MRNGAAIAIAVLSLGLSFGQEIDKAQFSELEHRVEAIQRDQLNYQIERDLLKEAYQSNLQTVNIVITIILGTFTALGFIGLRNISQTNAEFKTELTNIKKLREEFESAMALARGIKEASEAESKNIERINAEQNRKIEAIEMTDKVNSLIKRKSYTRALGYAEAAVKLDSENIELLQNYALCLFRLRKYSDAIPQYQKLLKLDSEESSYKLDLLEIYLLSGKNDEFSVALEEYKHEIERSEDGKHYLAYLKILSFYLLGKNVNNMIKKAAKDYSATGSGDFNWDFSDAMAILAKKPNTKGKEELVNLISFYKGKLDIEGLLAIL